MLVLTRKPGEKIMLGDDIVITVLENRGGEGIRIGIDAPRHVRIKRHEIFAAVADANRQAAVESPAIEQALLGQLPAVPDRD